MFKRIDTQRLVAVFFGGWFVFNFPLLGLWDRAGLIVGLPLFPAALFLIWALLIGVLAWIMERPGSFLTDD